jgi:hypothetical protein
MDGGASSKVYCRLFWNHGYLTQIIFLRAGLPRRQLTKGSVWRKFIHTRRIPVVTKITWNDTPFFFTSIGIGWRGGGRERLA